jgi:hypothetical protein
MLIDVETRLAESSFDEYPIQRGNGRITITTDSISFEQFQVDYYENSFETSGTVGYGDRIKLEIIARLGNLDRYKGKLFVDQPGGRGYAEATLTGMTAYPDLAGFFISDSLWLYGLVSDRFRADFSVDRFLTGQQGEVEITFFDGFAWDLPYDSGYAHLTLDSNLVTVDTLALRSETTFLSGKGTLDKEIYPRQMIIDTLSLTMFERSFHNDSVIAFQIDSSGFEIRKAALAGDQASLSLTGRIDFDESMAAQVTLKQVQMSPWLALFGREEEVDGFLSCQVDLGGYFLNPVIDWNGGIDSLRYRDLYLGDVWATLRYENQLLILDSFSVVSDTGWYVARGDFYANLEFSADDIDRLPNRPFDIRVTARDHRFDLVSLVMPSVEQLSGEFAADIRLSGTPQDPHLEGTAYLRKGRLKYFDLVDPIIVDSAGVEMVDNRINIEGITAYVKDKGKKRYANLEGEITVKSLDNFHYDLEIELPKEFPFRYELEDIEGKVEGDLQVVGDTPPLVTGDLTLISMKYRANFASVNEGSPIMAALSGENTWDLNINIDILSNYWIKNEDIDAQFSGFINILREKGEYQFVGEMEILRGRGFLFDKTFRIDPGSRITYDGIERLNPRLDIIARTRVPVSSFEEEETTSQEDLAIHITGTLENPEFNTLEGDARFTREDILPLLTNNYYSKNVVGSGLSALISSQVSQIGTRRLSSLGVETFEINPGYEGGQLDLAKSRVTLGFYTVPNLYLYGRSSLSGATGQEVGFEARFRKWLLLEGSRDEEELYHVNMRLHWEFE